MPVGQLEPLFLNVIQPIHRLFEVFLTDTEQAHNDLVLLQLTNINAEHENNIYSLVQSESSDNFNDLTLSYMFTKESFVKVQSSSFPNHYRAHNNSVLLQFTNINAEHENSTYNKVQSES